VKNEITYIKIGINKGDCIEWHEYDISETYSILMLTEITGIHKRLEKAKLMYQRDRIIRQLETTEKQIGVLL